MSRALGWCGVILAAGESTRMGRDKALLPWPPATSLQSSGQTFLAAAIRSLALHSDMVIVVAGNNEANLASVVYAEGASLVRNPAPERGQFSSLRVGLQEVLNRGRDAAIITVVDRPPAASATVDLLRHAFEAASLSQWAIVPEYGGKHGHPILISREMIEAFLRAPATATAREIEHANQERILYVAVDDPLTVVNINTPEDYAALVQGVAR